MEVIDRKLVRTYKAGYEIWDEATVTLKFEAGVISDPDGSAQALADAINETKTPETIMMRAAYTSGGDYIGNPKTAHFLCKKRAIRPELVRPDANVCSIGFCETEQKWYGWSHRAIYGFGVGSTVNPGDCGYVPKDKEDFRLDCLRFWDDEHHAKTWAVGDERGPDGESGVLTSWRYDKRVSNKEKRGKIGGIFTSYPETFGRGAWTAKSLDDAKQMAIDFAEGVG